MTCITFRKGIIAGDSAITEEGTQYGNMVKITRAPDGSIAGACGGASSIALFLRWIHGGRRGAKPNIADDKDFCGILVDAESTVTYYEAPMQPFIMTNDFYAIGSGSHTALGAMAAGADAVRAVRIACRFDVFCSEPIYVLRLDGEPHRLNPPEIT
jgi:hypothetical protein